MMAAVVGAMSLSLMGCGSSADETTTPDEVVEETTEAAEDETVAEDDAAAEDETTADADADAAAEEVTEAAN